jgi:polysaccharide export outer membrane protein
MTTDLPITIFAARELASRWFLRGRRRNSFALRVALVLSCSICGIGIGSAHAQTAAPASGAPSSNASSPAGAPAMTPAAGQSMLYPGEDFHLAPGDLIAVGVFMQADYQATVRVDLDGNIKLPFIGSVNVKDLTVRATQALIADRLRAGEFYKDPEVTVQVLDTVNGSVIITGELRQIVPVSTERSLKEVLLIAGGLPASTSHTIKIVRPGLPNPIVVDLGTDLASSTTANIPVYPHDIIQITRASVVYVLGAFSRQNAVPLDQASPLTLLQVVALSGGIGFEGKYDDLRLIRTVGTDRKVVKVDIKKVRDGKAPDPVLQANDIVFLPTDPMKAILKGLGVSGVLGMVSLLYSLKNY